MLFYSVSDWLYNLLHFAFTWNPSHHSLAFTFPLLRLNLIPLLHLLRISFHPPRQLSRIQHFSTLLEDLLSHLRVTTCRQFRIRILQNFKDLDDLVFCTRRAPPKLSEKMQGWEEKEKNIRLLSRVSRLRLPTFIPPPQSPRTPDKLHLNISY